MAEKGRDRIEPIKGSAEQDIFTAARRFYCYTQRAGVVKAIKRQFNKRTRKRAKQIVTEEAMNGD